MSNSSTRRISSTLGLAICLWNCGCPGPPDRAAVFLPFAEAAKTVNLNNTQINQNERKRPLRLFGRGRWSARFKDEKGKTQDHDGGFNLHAYWPNNLCIQTDLGVITNRLFEAGCDEEVCWTWQQFEADTLTIDTRQRWAAHSAERMNVPIKPDALMDALGIQLIDPMSLDCAGPLYRVVNDHHQILYLAVVDGDRDAIRKEYWLSRYEPFLIERVIYRRPDGRVVMEAVLSDHGAVQECQALMARRIRIRWPLAEAECTLTFNRLKVYTDVDNPWLGRPTDRPDPHPQPEQVRRLPY